MNKELDRPEEKLNYVNRVMDQLMGIARRAEKTRRYNLALSALSSYCNIQYLINQVYTDKGAEDLVLKISEDLVKVPEEYKCEENTVLFYDGFGMDLRGWAASFARALSNLGYNVVYVAPLQSKGKIPHIVAEVEAGIGKVEYIDMKNSYMKHIKTLNDTFIQHKPKTAFFYTTPRDVSGAAVFDAYKGKVTRVQIDLTDHAFWIGTNAFDYAIESRMLGCSNMVYNRKINKEKILWMDACPYINREIDNTPLPFPIEREKYFFSGGALYKTLGDENNYYYRIVNSILDNNKDIFFLYAGDGDDRELKKIINNYSKRAFHISERTDFIRLFENCVFFLNTYPMFGGLMMRYAAICGKIPLTLKHSADHEGILYNQDKLEIEYDTPEEVIQEAKKIIEREDYRRNKEKHIKGSVTNEKNFSENIRRVIEEGQTCYLTPEVEQIDTTRFRKEYLVRLNVEDTLLKSITTTSNINLVWRYPLLFLKKLQGHEKKNDCLRKKVDLAMSGNKV